MNPPTDAMQVHAGNPVRGGSEPVPSAAEGHPPRHDRRKRGGYGDPPRTTRSHGTATRRAFSLLEVVLVLVIIAIAAAIAVPRHAAALARYRAETGARRVAADLAHARSLAQQTSSDQTVVFDPDADCYTLAGCDDPDRPGQPYTVALAGRPYYADLAGATFGAGVAVTFNGFGAADQGGTVTVEVGDYTWTVTVDAESGEVSTSGP